MQGKAASKLVCICFITPYKIVCMRKFTIYMYIHILKRSCYI